MWGEIGDQVFSEENRKERMLLVDRRNILKIWSKMFGVLEARFVTVWRERIWRMEENVFGELENTFGELANTFGELENMFGELANTCSANWRIRVRQIGEYVFGELENMFSKLEKRVRRIGDLEKRGR